MDHVFNIDTTFPTFGVQWTFRDVFTSVSTATWLYLGQLACYVAVAVPGQGVVLTNMVCCLGAVLSIIGAGNSVRLFHQRRALHGFGCAAASALALLFWNLRFFIHYLSPLQ